MPIWVLSFIYLGVKDEVIIGCYNWNAIFVLQKFDSASKIRDFSISGQSHFHIKVCIVKDIRCVFLIISLRDFIIVVDAFNFFAKTAIVLNNVFPMVVVGLIPYVSILTEALYYILNGLI